MPNRLSFAKVRQEVFENCFFSLEFHFILSREVHELHWELHVRRDFTGGWLPSPAVSYS
jgi:hypothetical protein